MGYNDNHVNQQAPSSVSEMAYAAPPPAGYPVKDVPMNEQKVAVKTKNRGEGFWEGCCAALCCCCVFETCF